MTEGAAAFALTLECEGEVVMCVGVLRDQGDGLTIGFDGLVEALHLVEDVAEIEEGEGVAGVSLGGTAVEAFGSFEVALIVEDGAEVDAGGGAR